MNTEIDDRGLRFLTGVCDFKEKFPYASGPELDNFIERELDTIFGNSLPPDQKNSLAAYGRAWRIKKEKTLN